MKTRQISKCSSCKILHQSILKLHQEKITAVKNLRLRAQQKKRALTKRLNQKIERKELQLSKLKSQFESSVLAKDLRAANIKITSLEKKLKRYHKMKKLGGFSSETRRILKLETQLFEKDDEIFQLQDDKLTLEEKVKELASNIELTKPDGRTYSPENRMKV
ncbi:hypothetical protein LSH36_372g00016 [Paralvinella palmiformis]|uniref:Uncharacterized protein n=1 Tax=Paralvinella palmiformis TaxID=53620 RepID=A0AAD9N151_9ANNE|nr:hypothetical protein LSH36_372g00016 [Paralvinella palmiformis]